MSLQANPVKYLNQITEDLRMEKESRSATWDWKPATRHGLSSCRELFRHEEKSSLRLGFKFKNRRPATSISNAAAKEGRKREGGVAQRLPVSGGPFCSQRVWRWNSFASAIADSVFGEREERGISFDISLNRGLSKKSGQ
jgi:hypothetical protein